MGCIDAEINIVKSNQKMTRGDKIIVNNLLENVLQNPVEGGGVKASNEDF